MMRLSSYRDTDNIIPLQVQDAEAIPEIHALPMKIGFLAPLMLPQIADDEDEGANQLVPSD